MKYLMVLLISIFAAGVLATTGLLSGSPVAEAAGGGPVKKCGGGTISLNGDEKKTFTLHNRVRKNHDLKPLCVNPKLQKVARAHSKDMIQRDYFSHITKGTNRGGCARMKNAGYRYRYCAENIAGGQRAKGDPSNIMRNWMNSSGHRSNILNNRYREVGIGTETGTFNGKRNYTMYTADFGTRL